MSPGIRCDDQEIGAFEELQETAPEDLRYIGNAISDTVVNILEEKLFNSVYEPHTEEDSTGLYELRKVLEEIRNVESFDIHKFNHLAEENSRNRAINKIKPTIAYHMQSLANGKVLIFNDETHESNWVNIPKNNQKKFKDNLQFIELPPISGHEDDDHNDLPLGVHQAMVSVTHLLSEQVNSLENTIPTITEIVEHAMTGQDDGITIHKSSDDNGFILRATAGSKKVKSIRRKSAALTETLKAFIDGPEEVAAKSFIDYSSEDVDKWCVNLIEGIIVERNTKLYQSLNLNQQKTVKERQAPEQEKLTKKEKRRLKKLARQATQQSGIEKPKEQEITESESVIEYVDISIPWVENGQSVTQNIREFISNGNSLYIVNGMEAKLQEIADKTLEKSDIAPKVDNVIIQHARLINDDHMPWDRSSPLSVKMLNKNGSAPQEYQDETIWYTYDLSSNAPRVYYTLKDASQIETTNPTKLDGNKKCLVIVAITDKQKQKSTLKHLTGKKHSSLTAEGVGSI